MARKSRKELLGAVVAPPNATAEKVYKTAVYARLSAEDRQETNSLDNQILLVKKYIEQTPELVLSGVFADNGLTGTNFDRPGFESLMENIRCGKIDCIAVKDLSRFGRDYVEAGNFLEVILPRLNVRFISIGDNYDSFDPRCQGEGICIALKNMINAFYAKDISVKTQAAYAAKQRKGDFYGAFPPFGYLKSPENKNKLIVDKVAAAVVRDIFRWKLEGMGMWRIAKTLDAMGVPTPGHYRYITGIYCDKRYKEPQLWNSTTVGNILENRMYLGHMVTGKYRVDPNKLYNYVRQEKEKWIVVHNTHEALVSQSDFDIVAEQVKQNKEKYFAKQGKTSSPAMPENIFQGLAFCSRCGRAMHRRKSVASDNLTLSIVYFCPNCRQKKAGDTKPLRFEDFHAAVYAGIMQQIAICADKRKLIGNIVSAGTQQAKLESQINSLKQRFNRFPARRLKLHNDLCDGFLSESEYRLINEKHNKENEEIAALLCELENEKKKFLPQFVDENKWVTVFERFQSEKQLTRDMLLELIERIEVGGDMKIEIHYRYQDEYAVLNDFITGSEVRTNA